MTQTGELRTMQQGDLDQVQRLAGESFSSPWTRQMFADVLSRESGLHCRVVELAGSLVGYMVCARYGDEWHVMSIATTPRLRKTGVASRLIEDLLTQIGNEARVTLEVRASNIEAIAFYQHRGFMIAGRRAEYYPENKEDAVIMWRTAATLRGSLDDVPNASPQVS